MYEIRPKQNKEWVLERLPQEQIMEYYLRVPIQVKQKFKSPLREDNNPSCSFFYTKAGKLYFRDFSKSESLDCFDIASMVLGTDFKGTLRQIISDFNLNGPGVLIKNYDYLEEAKSLAQDDFSNIEISPLNRNGLWHMDPSGIKFWDRIGITPATLRTYKVLQLEFARCNARTVYNYDKDNPGFAYYFGEDQFKLYFPYSTGMRFLQNTNCLQGQDQLPESGPLLVVTKSMKDVMLFYEYNIPAVAPQSESFCFDDDCIEDWRKRFDRIVIVYDYDYTGVKFANKWRKKYGWDFAFVEGAKDLSDLYLASPYNAEQWVSKIRQERS